MSPSPDPAFRKDIIPFIDATFSDGKVPSHALNLPIGCNNWIELFPCSPEVHVSLWHNGSSLFISYNVKEDFVRALAEKDNDKVCEDSCVEFFISFDDKGYYNLEANCVGKLLLSHRRGRKIDVEYAPEDILSGIKRVSSLGLDKINERKQDEPWNLTLSIPVSTFFKHSFPSFDGIEAKCNIYKCGDRLPAPHYLSLHPISTSTPDFHRPEFFQSISFGSR